MRVPWLSLTLAACFERRPLIEVRPGESGVSGCLQVSPMRVDLAGQGDTQDITLAPSPGCGSVSVNSVRLDDPDSAFLWTADLPLTLEAPVSGRIELEADEPGLYEAQLVVEPTDGSSRISVQIAGEIEGEDTDR